MGGTLKGIGKTKIKNDQNQKAVRGHNNGKHHGAGISQILGDQLTEISQAEAGGAAPRH